MKWADRTAGEDWMSDVFEPLEECGLQWHGHCLIQVADTAMLLDNPQHASVHMMTYSVSGPVPGSLYINIAWEKSA